MLNYDQVLRFFSTFMGLGLEEAHYTSKGLRAKRKWSLKDPIFAVTLSIECKHMQIELTNTFWDSHYLNTQN